MRLSRLFFVVLVSLYLAGIVHGDSNPTPSRTKGTASAKAPAQKVEPAAGPETSSKTKGTASAKAPAQKVEPAAGPETRRRSKHHRRRKGKRGRAAGAKEAGASASKTKARQRGDGSSSTISAGQWLSRIHMEEEYESGVKSLDEEEPPQFIPSWVLYLSGLGAAFITLSFVYRFYKEYQRLKSGKEDDDGDIALRLQNRNNLFGSLLNISIMGRHRRLSDIESDGGRHSFTKMKSRLSDNFTPSPLSSSIVRSIDAVPSQVASRKRAFQPSKIELMSGDTVQSTFTRTPCIRGLKGNIIFTAPMVQKAFAMLPTKYRIRDLRLLYKGSVDGFNIRTFYTRVRHQGPNLLIVQDMKKHVFGAFVPSSWRKSEYYYGTGETFVMKLHPEFKPYTWTSKNSYFVLAKNDFIAIGGGSNFAIWLDQSFRKGSSLPCDTFDSPELSKTGDFTCMDLEVYGFDDPSYVPPA